MKIGIRKPSIRKSIAARTTGRVKRSVRKATTPFYGKKGAGWIKNPKRAAYNAVYHRTTAGISNLTKTPTAKPRRSQAAIDADHETANAYFDRAEKYNALGLAGTIVALLLCFLLRKILWILIVPCAIFFLVAHRSEKLGNEYRKREYMDT